ncbi:hypothetical protein M758_5G119700 [Ceratodon purpureus]|nr:hypothetical protein M758_5G119700 [Ceratodon purpureus]
MPIAMAWVLSCTLLKVTPMARSSVTPLPSHRASHALYVVPFLVFPIPFPLSCWFELGAESRLRRGGEQCCLGRFERRVVQVSRLGIGVRNSAASWGFDGWSGGVVVVRGSVVIDRGFKLFWGACKHSELNSCIGFFRCWVLLGCCWNRFGGFENDWNLVDGSSVDW